MPNLILLAHSPRRGVPGQTYFEHVINVRRKAIDNATKATAYYKGDRNTFVAWLEAAALYHDLGKLDPVNQAVLQKDSRKPLPIAHDDAGAADLINLGRQEAAILVRGHHEGMFSLREELAKQGRPFRDIKRTTPEGVKVADHVERELDNYRSSHSLAKCPVLHQSDPLPLHECGFTRRIACICQLKTPPFSN